MAEIKQPKINHYAKMLDNDHQATARQLVTDGYTNEEIRNFLDAINFYPNKQWWKWVSQRRAEIKAAATINKSLGMKFFN